MLLVSIGIFPITFTIPAKCLAISGYCNPAASVRLPLSIMALDSLQQIMPDLRDAVGPVILISGVGLLLLTMTNRLGRAIDRSRILKRELKEASEADRPRLQSQINILYRRAKIIRFSILSAVLSALLAALLVVTVFVCALMGWGLAWFAALTFVACLVSLSVSLIAFLGDIDLSLKALKLELEKTD